jgi:glutathione S-transferase
MARIETTRSDIGALKGLHLFHFRQSNCSQRVRLVLCEKGLDWTSHHINLTRNQHLSAEFREINPKGVVPVLVHDGETITESNDIISYIDSVFPQVPLQPEDDADVSFVTATLAVSSHIQSALKLLSHEFLFKPVRRMKPPQLREFAITHPDPTLVQFMQDFSSKAGFGDVRIRDAVGQIMSAFTDLDARLNNRNWLSGPKYGLADISWIVNVHRLVHIGLPLHVFPALAGWYQRCIQRPNFAAAVSAYEPKAELTFFKVYRTIRRIQGTGIDKYA